MIEQGFIQVILMSGRRHKKTQSSNWVLELNFIEFLFEAYPRIGFELAFKNKVACYGLFYFQLLFTLRT